MNGFFSRRGAWDDPVLAPMPSGSADKACSPCVPDEGCGGDLSREVYCVLGIAIDAIEMPAVLDCIEAAAAKGSPFVVSTPNLNFLVSSLTDPVFRETILQSDLCTTDGMPVVWIARLMGIPIKGRIAGSDIFECLKGRQDSQQRLKVFLFGGTEGVADAASKALQGVSGGLTCVGWIYPGFGTVEEMSADGIIDRINSSRADFLMVAVAAKKGQLWLQRNHHRLRIPVRANLGATINFQAGIVRRAPRVFQILGLEWLWRIKEEPHLWGRYWHDGTVLLRLLLTQVLPVAVVAHVARMTSARVGNDLAIKEAESHETFMITLLGDASARHVEKAVLSFRRALTSKKHVSIDLSSTRIIDARFLGLLLMLRKQLKVNGVNLRFTGGSPRLKRLFRLNGADFLLSAPTLM